LAPVPLRAKARPCPERLGSAGGLARCALPSRLVPRQIRSGGWTGLARPVPDARAPAAMREWHFPARKQGHPLLEGKASRPSRSPGSTSCF